MRARWSLNLNTRRRLCTETRFSGRVRGCRRRYCPRHQDESGRLRHQGRSRQAGVDPSRRRPTRDCCLCWPTSPARRGTQPTAPIADLRATGSRAPGRLRPAHPAGRQATGRRRDPPARQPPAPDRRPAQPLNDRLRYVRRSATPRGRRGTRDRATASGSRASSGWSSRHPSPGRRSRAPSPSTASRNRRCPGRRCPRRHGRACGILVVRAAPDHRIGSRSETACHGRRDRWGARGHTCSC